MTISSVSTIKACLKSNGELEDGAFVRIYQYKGMSGKPQFACFTEDRFDDIHQSPYVQDPVCLFDHGLTPEGEEFLATK